MASTVIVGSGLAGYTVAREACKRNKADEIIVVTQDDGHFYSKPVLSEVYRLGIPVNELVSRTAEEMARQFKGRVLADTKVLAIDPAARTLALDRGSLGYDKLVLALGAEPAALALDSESLGCLVTVNSLADYRRFRQLAEGKKTIAIIGAGLIGCEFANDLVRAGYAVTVIDIAPLPLPRLLPDANGQYTYAALEGLGVRWHLGTGVAALSRRGDSIAVALSDGTQLTVDLVLAATGLRPRTELARRAGLQVAHGIAVNRELRTSDRNIYALGDCAEIGGLWLPYIAPIAPAARAVAASLAGGPQSISYPCMPVTIKTPACPTVACPPAPRAEGRWHSIVADDGVQSLFQDSNGQLLGFALSGAYAERAAELAPALPALLH